MKIIGILVAILCFIILIISHEFGHFSVAKILGVKVNEFSVGMGPLAYQKQKGETQYSIRYVPIGGYCALEGENGDSDDPRSFSNQPVWSKILILVAGAFMNVLIGLLIFTFIFMKTGTASQVIAEVVENSPAHEAGILAGDKIVAVNDVYYNDFTSVQTAILSSKDDTIKLTVQRNKQEQDIVCNTYINEYGNKGVGIMAAVSYSFGECFKAGLRESGLVAVSIKEFFVGIFKGQTSFNDVSGVVGIVSIAGQAAEFGLLNVIYLMALISVNLGYMNLLPFPALDGGRILLTFIRTIFKGKITDEAEGVIHAVGIIILLLLMVIILFKDVIRLFH